MSNFRIKICGDGWVSEIRKPVWTLFGIRYKWVPYITVRGISDKPWIFSTREFAEQETLKQLKIDINC